LLDGVEDLFAGGSSKRTPDPEALQGELYEQIGRLQMELARWASLLLVVQAIS
jgi:hypothetical protein